MALPPFDDRVVYLEMSEEQQRDYRSVYNTCWQALLKYWPRFTASWLQWTLARPNSCFREETIALPDGDTVVVEPVVDVRAGELLPKEEWLQATVRAELAQNRRCLVYLRQTGTRDIRPRLVQVLAQAGIQAQVLSESIEPRRREAWLKKHRSPVLITNPKLVETGLDLVEYSTAIFFEPDYSLYCLWQACRRVWRLGQTQPVKVFYVVYVDTMEDLALRLIGQKMAAAQLLYGEDVAGAIVPDMDDNLVVQLVNAIKAGEHEQLKKVDGLFGNDDQATWSPVGSPTRISPPLVSWTEWLRARGLRLEDVRPPRRRRPQATPPSGQMAFAWGG
jgi:SNF2 family DNA or RNA helicase